MEHTYLYKLKCALGFRWNKKRFHVHHINHNHEDDRIENLVLLPSILHQKYHTYYSYLHSRCLNIFNASLTEDVLIDIGTIENFIQVKKDMLLIYRAEFEAISMKRLDKDFKSAEYIYRSVGNILKKYDKRYM